jgi:hypothetical protein
MEPSNLYAHILIKLSLCSINNGKYIQIIWVCRSKRPRGWWQSFHYVNNKEIYSL